MKIVFFVRRQVKAMMIDGVQGCPTETILLTMRDRRAERKRERDSCGTGNKGPW